MPLPDKLEGLESAVARIPDGAVLLVGGFGVPGTPFTLLRELERQGQQQLTLIRNDANEPGTGIDRLLRSGQVRRLVTSHIGLNAHAIERMNEGSLDVEFCAQGILAERIRAGGAGIPAILTDVGLGTELAAGKTIVEVEGRPLVLEMALRADVALVHAATADPFGNLTYAATARNFNPPMAMAADRVVAETESLVALGDLSAENVETPGSFVDAVVLLSALTEDYGIVCR